MGINFNRILSALPFIVACACIVLSLELIVIMFF